MRSLLVQKKIDLQNVKRIINWYYKPNVKIISYSITLDANEIYLYSHAPIGLSHIEDISIALNIQYSDASILSLCATIDHINDKFLNNFVIPERVKDLYSKLLVITNNRDVNGLHRPHLHNGYNVFFVHGHHDYDVKDSNVFNLENNNLLGKTEDQNIGTLNIFNFRGIYMQNLPDKNESEDEQSVDYATEEFE
ncbi:MAG: hypothetical protein CNLJKLNK_01288 [Holosporales bacterium]